MANSPLIDSLMAAVAANPDDLPLRLHLAEMLLTVGRRDEAIAQAAQVLTRSPGDPQAQALMARVVSGPGQVPMPRVAPDNEPTEPLTFEADPADLADPAVPAAGADAVPNTSAPKVPNSAANEPSTDSVDWSALEADFADVVPPRFVTGDGPGLPSEPVRGAPDRVVDVETTTIQLADIAGMDDVKKRLEVAYFGPMRSEKLRKLYGKSLRGGLLLYGPPGCGKTFLARAVAGELGAQFVSLSITDVLNEYLGASERNLHTLFETARANGPCVLFLDELDALGHKRSQLNSSALRTIGNQLLTELDGVENNNDGLFVLAATNAPWDIDPALRRPGRFDRVVLVLPPDKTARAGIINYHLRDRPIAGIDVKKIAAATEDFSGADLAHLCDSAAETAMYDSMQTGTVRMIEQRDFDSALREIRPSTGPWMSSARNVALYGNEGGMYDELAAYLKKRKLL